MALLAATDCKSKVSFQPDMFHGDSCLYGLEYLDGTQWEILQRNELSSLGGK
jgi:hypothetical protein